jgi:hypothetical protein
MIIVSRLKRVSEVYNFLCRHGWRDISVCVSMPPSSDTHTDALRCFLHGTDSRNARFMGVPGKTILVTQDLCVRSGILTFTFARQA